MKTFRSLVTVILLAGLLFSAAVVQPAFTQRSSETSGLDGFTAEGSVAERRWEIQFSAVPAAASAREHLRRRNPLSQRDDAGDGRQESDLQVPLLSRGDIHLDFSPVNAEMLLVIQLRRSPDLIGYPSHRG